MLLIRVHLVYSKKENLQERLRGIAGKFRIKIELAVKILGWNRQEMDGLI